jgi:hypothetical protein
MRPCFYYSIRGYLYVFSFKSAHYKRYFRVNRQCELAPSDAEIERFYKEAKKLFDGAKKARVKAVYLIKQRRIIFKRFRDLSDREDRNILELELNEMVDLKIDERIGNIPERTSSEILNLFSPRSFSFLNFALLGSPGRILVEPFGS